MGTPVIVGFVPSYCLKHRNPELLGEMSIDSTLMAKDLFEKGVISEIILSLSYATWFKELNLKLELLKGIASEKIHVISETTDSYDETRRAGVILEKLGADAVILMAEEWHAPRAVNAFMISFPKLIVGAKTFPVRVYERTLEPSRIKSIRSRFKCLWIAWQLLFELLTPIMARKK